MRIVCLVPSLSEYLWALGLDEQVVGITKFCVHPNHWWREKTRVGGTKQLHLETIAQLEPTLIIANKEENTKEDVVLLQAKYEVLLTDIQTLDDAYFYLLEIGKRVGRKAQANELIGQIKKGFEQLGQIGKGSTFLYFIWKDPFFVVGPNTYIHSLLTHIGLENFCSIERYPELQEVLSIKREDPNNPDIVILSSEPYPFKKAHIAAFQERFPHSKVLLIDGEMCSWYGAKMLLVPAYLKGVFLE
jgi:ABC-type Fe3+-hydroxamate transport system substrate-binding protein